MMFQYLRPPSFGNLMNSRDCFYYLDLSKKAFGLLPPKPGSSRYWWLYYMWTGLIAVTAIVYAPTVFFITYHRALKTLTATDLFASLQAPIKSFSSSTKAIIVFINYNRFVKINELLDRMDRRIEKHEDRVLIHRTAVRSNYVDIFFHFLYFGYLFQCALNALLLGKTPYRLYNPVFGTETFTFSFYMATLVELFIVGIALSMNLITDVYPIVFGLIMRSHIELLRRRIEELRSDVDKSEEKNYNELVDCIKDHKLIMNYCDIMRPVITKTLFMQMLMVGLLLGLSIVYVFFFADLWTAIATINLFIAYVFESFPFCYICNQLENDASTLSQAIFQSNWIDASPRYKSTLIYFMHHVQKPIEFNAGGIFSLNVNTNVRMAKLAFSVVTIVDQMNLADKMS
ncbi:odorant receptor 85a [Drosophila willistoni]|nr:odorant receptor 85a [Drosophila willistoni]